MWKMFQLFHCRTSFPPAALNLEKFLPSFPFSTRFILSVDDAKAIFILTIALKKKANCRCEKLNKWLWILMFLYFRSIFSNPTKQNLDALHDHLGTLYPGMRAPSFRCTEEPDGSLILHYYSERPGLEHIVIGIVKVSTNDRKPHQIWKQMAND